MRNTNKTTWTRNKKIKFILFVFIFLYCITMMVWCVYANVQEISSGWFYLPGRITPSYYKRNEKTKITSTINKMLKCFCKIKKIPCGFTILSNTIIQQHTLIALISKVLLAWWGIRISLTRWPCPTYGIVHKELCTVEFSQFSNFKCLAWSKRLSHTLIFLL